MSPVPLSRDTSAATDDLEATTQDKHDDAEVEGIQSDSHREKDDDRDKIYVDALHLRALDALLCAALEAPTSLSPLHISSSSHHKRDRSAKKEVGPSHYVKMVRLLVRYDVLAECILIPHSLLMIEMMFDSCTRSLQAKLTSSSRQD